MSLHHRGFGGQFEKGDKLKNIAVTFLIGESIFQEKGYS